MFSRSKVLANAYLATDYTVQIDHKDLVLRPNERPPVLDRALSRSKPRGAALITAFNPYSRMRGTSANLAAHAAFSAQGERFIGGYGRGRDKLWPAVLA